MKNFYRVLWGAALASAASAVFALGFGEISLNSALNQPLKATVPVFAVNPDQRDAVTVRIASPETFKRFGIARPNVLDDIQVELTPGSSADRMNVSMRSRRAIREPFLTFLLEAEWPQGRAIREYTVLLDPPIAPPTVATRPTPAPAPATPAAAPRSAPAARPQTPGPAPAPVVQAPVQPAAPAAARPAPATPPARNTPPAPSAPAPRPAGPAESTATQPLGANIAAEGFTGKYGPVQAGETLSGIASQVRPAADITMNQLLLGLYRSNPDAFDGNMNLIRRGAVLFVPTEEEFRSISKRSATAEVVRQNTALRASRTRVAASDSGPAESSSPSQSRGGELRLAPAPADLGGSAAEQATTAQAPRKEEAADTAGDAEFEADALAAQDPGENLEPLGAEDASPADAMESAAGDAPEEESALATDELEIADSGNLLEEEELEALGVTDEGSAEPQGAVVTSAEDEGTSTGAAIDAASLGQEESVIPEDGKGGFPWVLLLLLMGAASLGIAIILFLRNRQQYKPVDFSESSTRTAAAGGGLAAAAYGRADDDESDDELADDDTLRITEAGEKADVSPAEAVGTADAQLAAGDWRGAADTLNAALVNHPEDSRLQRKLMEALYEGGARDEFLDEVDNAYAGVSDNDPNWQAVAAMGRELAPGDPRFDGVPENAASADIHSRPGDSPGVHNLDDSDVAEFDLSDFDDDSSEFSRSAGTYGAGAPGDSKPGMSASDFEIGDDDLHAPVPDSDDDSTRAEIDDASRLDPGEKGSVSADDEFDLGNDALDFEFSDSMDKKEAPAAGDTALDEPEIADSSTGADDGADEGLSISQMDDLSLSDDDDLGGEAGEDDVSIKMDLARAYLDMGEPDMAIPLLEEVKAQGSGAQKSEAESLLSRAR